MSYKPIGQRRPRRLLDGAERGLTNRTSIVTDDNEDDDND